MRARKQVEVIGHVEKRENSEMVQACSAGTIRLVMELTGSMDELWYHARRGAIDMAQPLVTNPEQALLMAEALEKYGSTESVVPTGAFREGDQCDVETYEEIVELGR